MKLNWISYYMQFDGYGRFSSRMVRALRDVGVKVKSATMDHRSMPRWMQEAEGIDWDTLTISFLPPYFLQSVPGRHWLFSMTEGSRIPEDWVKTINNSNVERVVVPCVHNQIAFQASGVVVPVSVVNGGTDPGEFSFQNRYRKVDKISGVNPYTFLTIADRGFRKGWYEVWQSFYLAFGGKTSGDQSVRLTIKCRPRKNNSTLSLMMAAKEGDRRINYDISDPLELTDLYRSHDCLVLPSRSEGWGMPHREAAMTGMPVMSQHYAGIDDGHAERWCMNVPGKLQPIPKETALQLGEWRIADREALAQQMRFCRYSPETVASFGAQASHWLRNHQTWQHSANTLVELIRNA